MAFLWKHFLVGKEEKTLDEWMWQGEYAWTIITRTTLTSGNGLNWRRNHMRWRRRGRLWKSFIEGERSEEKKIKEKWWIRRRGCYYRCVESGEDSGDIREKRERGYKLRNKREKDKKSEVDVVAYGPVVKFQTGQRLEKGRNVNWMRWTCQNRRYQGGGGFVHFGVGWGREGNELCSTKFTTCNAIWKELVFRMLVLRAINIM